MSTLPRSRLFDYIYCTSARTVHQHCAVLVEDEQTATAEESIIPQLLACIQTPLASREMLSIARIPAPRIDAISPSPAPAGPLFEPDELGEREAEFTTGKGPSSAFANGKSQPLASPISSILNHSFVRPPR